MKKSKNITKVIFVSFAFILSSFSLINAEENDTLSIKNNTVYSGFFQEGTIIPTNTFLRLMNINNEEFSEFDALSFQITKQTYGKESWEQYFGYPTYGIGIFVARFYNSKYLSLPISVYGVFKAPIKRWDNLSLNYNAGFGFTANWESFNPAENNYNISFGTTLSTYIDFGISLNYKISSHVDLGAGFSLTHFSNGAMKVPNSGLNTLAPKISLDYYVNRLDHPKIKPSLTPCIKNTYLDFSIYGGEKSVYYPDINTDTTSVFDGLYYPVFGLNTIINRQISHKSLVGFGMTLGYDGTKNAVVNMIEGKPKTDLSYRKENITLAIYPSYELLIHQLSFYVQPCFYIIKHQTTYKRPTFFARIGLKYHFKDNLYATLGLHAYNFSHADFLEWTIGYRIPFLTNE